MTSQQLQTALTGYLQNCILCTDAASVYEAFTRANNIPLQVLNARRGIHKHGIYHLNNVNACERARYVRQTDRGIGHGI